jgi:hypothetical protein
MEQPYFSKLECIGEQDKGAFVATLTLPSYWGAHPLEQKESYMGNLKYSIKLKAEENENEVRKSVSLCLGRHS